MNTQPTVSGAKSDGTEKPLVELLHRARRSNDMLGLEGHADVEGLPAVYVRLGKLLGR